MVRRAAEETPLIPATHVVDNNPTITIEDSTTNNNNINNNMANNNNSNNCGRITFVTFLILLIAFGLICIFEFAFVVPPGYVGIIVTVGQVQSVNSGIHYRIPFFSHVELMSTKIQLLEEQNVVPTKEGLAVKLDTAVLYRLDANKATQLYSHVGANYDKLIVEPEAASAVRGLTSEYEAKALYSSGRNMIQDSLKKELINKLSSRGIIIEDILLKDIVLPEQLSKSIELKVQAEQDAARMEFILSKESQEAQRKAIEAKGIAEFQHIVSEGITPELLKWKGVETTKLFASSTNTKIIIMGNDANGLPVILSTGGDTDGEK